MDGSWTQLSQPPELHHQNKGTQSLQITRFPGLERRLQNRDCEQLDDTVLCNACVPAGEFEDK